MLAIELPEETEARLAAVAKAKGQTAAACAREAIRSILPAAGRPSGNTNVTKELLDKVSDKPETVRMSLDIEVGLHTKLKTYAARRRKTVIGVVREFIAGLEDD